MTELVTDRDYELRFGCTVEGCYLPAWPVDDGGDYGRHGTAVCPKHDTPEGREAAYGRYASPESDVRLHNVPDDDVFATWEEQLDDER